MAEPLLLRVRDVSATLAGRSVLTGVSLALGAGELCAVLGPNGAGKSTLLRAILGLVPHRGEVSLEGARVDALTPEQRARRVSFVPQESELAAALPVRDVVSLGRYAHAAFTRPASEDDSAVERALIDCDVQALAHRPFSDLSTGEKKRVLIARALCTGARTLLLDEPTAALDIEHALKLFALLRRVAREGRAVLVVLHQIEHALAYADRALLLQAGKPLALGAVHEVLTAANVRTLYGVELIEGGAPGFRLLGEEP
jgi:iron complex transport system ATP-binding protein